MILLLLALQYDVQAEGVDAKDVTAMLQALHEQLRKHFGTAPKEKLRIEIYSTRDRWADALRRDGQPVPEAGGYYSPGTKKAYLFVQPSEYFTRQLILHEATHQFHYLAATGNRNPQAGWYTEGIAEYFGMHNWDGRTLKTGVVPAVTLEDYPERALRNFDALKRDLEGMIAGSTACDRPEAWALIHFLIHNHRKQFDALSRALDRGERPAAAWKASFGKFEPDLAKRYREWIEKHAQPWKVVWVGWQERGETIEGRSEVNGIAVLKKSPEKLTAEVDLKEGKLLAGLVFGFESADKFHLAQVQGNEARVVRRLDGKWQVLKTVEIPEGKRILTATRSGTSVEITVNGQDLGRYEVAGTMGLHVDSCRVEFRVVR